MKKLARNIFALGLGVSGILGAQANTVLLSENFDGEWSGSFPVSLELDKLPPASSINPLFMDGNGVSRPWWTGKESSTTTDRFLMSHSYYQHSGTSNDWLVSGAIEIPTTGFNLTFQAQSLPMRSADRLSSLWVFITEEEVTADNLPTDPAMFIEAVPFGNDKDVVEGDFIDYSLNLDKWAGKRVYLSFANLNTDKDILCLDNVKIERKDAVELSASCVDYILAGDYAVKAQIVGVEGVDSYSLSFLVNGREYQKMDGQKIGAGEKKNFTFRNDIAADKTDEWEVLLTAEGWEPVSVKGRVTGLLFNADRRVLFEEATGVWCTNCPLGIYNVECMMDDEEIKEKVIPVAIHIQGGSGDPMINQAYASAIGLTSAPMVKMNRSGQIYGFSGYDFNFDKTNPQTVGYAVLQRAAETTFVNIDMEARFNVEGADTTSIATKVVVRPNITLKETPLAIGFILTENNVGLDGHNAWRQENGTAGNPNIASQLNGWTKLDKKVDKVRYQEVARQIYGFNGLPNSLPEVLACGEEYEFEYTLDIPDTYSEGEDSKGNMRVNSPAVCAANTIAIAYVVNQKTGEILNAVSVPMTEQAEDRFTTADLVKMLSGVECVGVSASDDEVRYFNLQGMPLAAPSVGEPVIVKRGGKSSKEIYR